MPLASQIMDSSAALLNDTAVQIFTHAKQLPYLKLAWQELREICQQNNIGISNKVSTSIIVAAGVTVIDASTVPSLPGDLIEIQELYERLSGSTDDYIPMVRVEFLPPTQVQTNYLTWWSWNGQKLEFIGSTSDQQIRMDYVADLFTTALTPNSNINMINADSFLEYRTAALCAQFIGENAERATVLNQTAQLAIDRFLSINTKGRQSISTRRRPFMQGYKNLNNMY